MQIYRKGGWTRYHNTELWNISSLKDCGKWTVTWETRSQAKKYAILAIEEGVTNYVKHTLGEGGAMCFYVSGTDYAGHLKTLNFLINNNLLTLDSNYNYKDISFKFNSQSWMKEYGDPFAGMIKLSDFINLTNGKFLQKPNIDDLITISDIPKSKFSATNQDLAPLITAIDKHIIVKVNKTFDYQKDSIDINQKLSHLIPFAYNYNSLYKATNYEQFLKMLALIISHSSLKTNSTYLRHYKQLKERIDTQIDWLFTLLDNTLFSNLQTEQYERIVISNFIISYNNSVLSTTQYNTLSYLTYLALYYLEPADIDNIITYSINDKKQAQD